MKKSRLLGAVCALGIFSFDVAYASTIFKIESLTLDNYVINTTHQAWTGDDRGGIALDQNTGSLFYNGDSYLGGFDSGTLATTQRSSTTDGVFSDLASGNIYSLGTSTTTSINSSSNSTVTHILGVNGVTGALDGTSIALSQSLSLGNNGGRDGIYVGNGYVLIHEVTSQIYNGSAAGYDSTGDVYKIDLQTGQVTNLGATTVQHYSFTENWAIWGVAEYFGGQDWLATMSFYDPNNVVPPSNATLGRSLVGADQTDIIQSLGNLVDISVFTVDPINNRWYWHNECSPEAITGSTSPCDETVGYADAVFTVSSVPIPAAIWLFGSGLLGLVGMARRKIAA